MNNREIIEALKLHVLYRELEGPINLDVVINLIDQLNLPELVVIPKFVADWIEECKKNKETISWAMASDKVPSEVDKWFSSKGYHNEEIFARAWVEGYEVEKEQLYWVRNSEEKSLLYRNDAGRVTTSGGHKTLTQENSRFNYTFTEREIKSYDERYWSFAIPVEVVE